MRRAAQLSNAVLAVVFVVAPLPALAQTLIGTINVGVVPVGVGVNPVTNRVYVTNAGNETDTVSVIDATTDTVIATVPVGSDPIGVAVNPVTNKIYIADGGDDLEVTEIDGATNMTTSIPTDLNPRDIAVDVTRNKIYVVNGSTNDVTVIDGATRSTRTVPVGMAPSRLAVNAVTNKIYVTNYADSTVTVIDGATLQTTTVNVAQTPTEIAVNSITNKIYVVAYDPGRKLDVIDGATLAVTEVSLRNQPEAVAVDQLTNEIFVADGNVLTVINGVTLTTVDVPADFGVSAVAVDPVNYKIYVPSSVQNTVTVVDGRTHNPVTLIVGQSPLNIAVNENMNRTYVTNEFGNTVSVIGGGVPTATQFVAVAQCRLVDTRQGQPILGGTGQSFVLPQLGGCNIPSYATAYSLNVTVVPRGRLGYLTLWPTGVDQPYVSTINSPDGRVKANAAVVPAGYQGAVSVYATDTTDVILDIDGYFATPGSQTLQFYPLAPCRVVDTRQTNFPPGLGAPSFGSMDSRRLPVLANSPCLQNLPNHPQAYSFNVTVVPNPSGTRLNYLTIWPSDQNQPVVSTLNNPTATVVANAAIVPAAQNNGDVSVFTYNRTDVIIDVNGYFAAPATGGYSFYPVAPCRVIDTRNNNGQPFSGMLNPPVNVVGSPCAPPSNATGYVFNATVVPHQRLGYLTLWPDGETQPGVSTLNAYDGFITSNMAIVPNMNGSTDAYAGDGSTQLILDISGYFAP